MSQNQPIRIGMVGANAERGWARDAHLPALKALPELFEIAAVSARTQELADASRIAFGASRAFGDSLELARDPGVDLVVVAVKVPEHRAVVLAALAAGKHVYCEWPLGRDVAEAQEMQAAVPPGSRVVIGLQALSAPAVRQAAKLVREGALGRLLSLRVVSPTAGWGAETLSHYAYLEDRRNGATLGTIAGGHTLSAIEAVVGAYSEVDARASILRRHVRAIGTDEIIERTGADHMMVLGRHESGCVSTLVVVGGTATTPFQFELEGERGWLRLSGGHPGGFQAGVLTLETSLPCEPQPAPAAPGLSGPPANLAEVYFRLSDDFRAGQDMLPGFDVAVDLSRLLERIERASATGERQC